MQRSRDAIQGRPEMVRQRNPLWIMTPVTYQKAINALAKWRGSAEKVRLAAIEERDATPVRLPRSTEAGSRIEEDEPA